MKKLSFLICLAMFPFFSLSQWTWQNPLPQGNQLYSVNFPDADTGYAVGNLGTIIKTTNGGVVFNEEHYSIESSFNVYPNPANKKIIIKKKNQSTDEMTLTLFNIAGEPVIFKKFNGQNTVELDVSALTKGIYLLKTETEDGVESKKIVLQ